MKNNDLATFLYFSNQMFDNYHLWCDDSEINNTLMNSKMYKYIKNNNSYLDDVNIKCYTLGAHLYLFNFANNLKS